MKRLVQVVLTSEERLDIEKRTINTVKTGKVHSQTIRTGKTRKHIVDVEIEYRPGITHRHERIKVRDGLRARANLENFFGFAPNNPAQFDHIRRRPDGSYIL
jgi:hypothetical protein